MKTINTKQRIILLVLPLFVLPFILAFSWAKQEWSTAGPRQKLQLNTELPQAQLEERTLNKMELYQLREKEAKRQRELIRMDPYRQDKKEEETQFLQPPLGLDGKGAGLQEKETLLLDKLEQLQGELNSSKPEHSVRRASTQVLPKRQPSVDISHDVKQLEELMDRIQPSGPDPELEQLEGMLDKILDVQHPERVRDRFKENALAKPRFQVSASNEAKPAVKEIPKDQNSFYGLEETAVMEQPVKEAIAAEIAETLSLKGSGRAKIRLLETVTVNGMEFKKGAVLYGTAIQDANRVSLSISAIRSGNHILPVELEAFDLDGMPGIPISGSIQQEIKAGAGDALVTGLPSLNGGISMEEQMASAGVSAAKGLFRKKSKSVKINLKAGHPILLVNQSTI